MKFGGDAEGERFAGGFPTTGQLQQPLQLSGWPFIAEAFGDGQKKSQGAGGGVPLNVVRVVRIDPAVFGEKEDFFGEAGAEVAGLRGGGTEDQLGLGGIDHAGGGGPGGASAGLGGAFFGEKRLPLEVGGGGLGGDGQGEGEVFESRVARLGAAHPDGFAFEGGGLAGLEFCWRGDFGLKQDIALVALCFDGEHEHAFWLWVFEVASAPAAWQVPLNTGGHTDDAGLFPVGVVAGFMTDENADVKGSAWLNVGDFAD